MKKKLTPNDYLKKPYARIVTPDEDGETYVAQILEFPGCIAEGKSPKIAYEHLERAAVGWIAAVITSGQQVPEPIFDKVRDYGGKVALRLPRHVHRDAVRYAEMNGTSLNTFLVSSVSAAVGAMSLYEGISKNIEAKYAKLLNLKAQFAMDALLTVTATGSAEPIPVGNIRMLESGATNG